MGIKFKEPKEGWIYRRGLAFLLPLYIVLAALYIYWRFHNAATWQAWYAYPLFFLEVYGILFTISHIFTTRKQLNPVWQKPERNSSVDIFITTYNEPEEIVKMTAIGALEVRGRRKVFLLDDGNRANIKKLAQDLGTEYAPRTTNIHAKAGNMNNGIKFSDAEFMVFLDCDHVPQPNFIERTLGYFNDRNIAFVQTPQLFYNSDSIQFRKTRRKMWNEQSMFYESIQPSKNRYNAAFFCGSGSILRRLAIDEVGGFATGTATEDIHTSLRLHAKGWSSLFLNEQLAHGIAPDDLSEYHKQRVRWGAGSLGLLFRSADSPLWTKGLSPMQRLCYINSTIAFLGGILRLAFVLLPIIVIVSLPFDAGSSMPVLSYLMVSSLFAVFSYTITYLFSRGTFHPLYTEQFNIINIFSNIMSTKGIVNIQKKFKVSIKHKRPKREANAYRGLLVLWFATFTACMAGLHYWFFYLGNSFEQLSQNVVGAAMFWNLVNLGLVGSILWYVNFHNEKIRSKHSLRATMAASIEDAETVKVERISLRGADLITTSPVIKKSMKLVLDPANNLVLKANVETAKLLKDGRWRLEVAFPKLSKKEYKQVTILMFGWLVPLLFKTERAQKKKFFSLNPASLFGRIIKRPARNPT